ncbi:MAG: asparagine synthase-related protein [Campylobacterota bacterium]|nr:asparagine synthase-related protein [Campylobacterota bacterium]
MFEKFNYLGDRKYYCSFNNSNHISVNIGDVLGKEKIVDPISVIGILMKNYPMGTRTLISQVQKTPWMARPNGEGGWEYANLPKHGELKLSAKDIAITLKEKLEEEALEFLQNKKTIGILLSGGMDSRIIAGIVRQLQVNGDYTGEVVALTWGLSDSRDVIYSKRISEKFNWEFMHFPINEEVLRKNIILTGEMGAEFSPVHLHAMKAVSEVQGLDGILAGSYGDSIGRGEYSGRKLDKLPSILSKGYNHYSFMLKDLEKESIEELENDLEKSRNNFFNRSELEYREIEMQMHYMNRQLNSCMSLIDEKIPLYQMFTSPSVFGYMWSLSKECRNDDVYEELLLLLTGELLDIPWARNGKLYNQKQKEPLDSYSTIYNHYGDWLRKDNRDFIIEKIGNGTLQGLGIFNENALEIWMKKWPYKGRKKANRLDEKMAWLASLSVFVEKYNIQPVTEKYNHTFNDTISEKKSILHTWLYHKSLEVLKNEA